MKRLILLLRRVHLYTGLLLLPWAILYAVTAFLFNHPAAFSDQPTANFSKEATAGTPLESVPSLREQAEQVVAKLNELHKPEVPYTLGTGELKYNREFAFATVKTKDTTVSVLVDVKHGGGTVRSVKDKPTAEPVTAPFAVGNRERGRPARSDAGGTPALPATDGIKFDQPLTERVKSAVPTILSRTHALTAEQMEFLLAEQVKPSDPKETKDHPHVARITQVSAPDLVFPIEAEGRTWTATYNATTGSVSGALPEAPAGPNWRQFLLRLHTAHGYPGETNARWGWAVIVDVMAAVMVFWGLSGLVMWWQVKATRIPGAVVLVLSAIVATILGVMMYVAMAG